MEGIVKGLAVALAVTAATLVLAFIFIPFQWPTSGNNANEQSNGTTAASPQIRDILLIANENIQRVAPDNDLYPGGLWHQTMTFNGTIPGPLIFANQGDTLRITLRNEGNLVHSLNFHAGFGPSKALSGVVNAGENKTWTMKVDYPGAFLYHCDGDNLNGIWEHIADGMYGGIVVRAAADEPARKEFYVAFSELYDTNAASPLENRSPPDGVGQEAVTGSFDMNKFLARKPDLVLTNGMAFRYIPSIGTNAKVILNTNAEVFHVKAGELTRWYLFNAGPRNNIAFNFGGGLIKEVVYSADGNDNGSGPSLSSDSRISKAYDEVVNMPPGSGTIIEFTFPEAGTYFGNDHDVGSVLYGAGFVVRAE